MAKYFSIHAAPTIYATVSDADKRLLPFRGDVVSIIHSSTPPTPTNRLVYAEITDFDNFHVTAVAVQGSGDYAENDVLTLVGGTGTAATLEVTAIGGTQATIAIVAVGGTGALDTVEIINPGYGYWTDGTAVAQAGGDGTIDYTVSNGAIVSVSINNAGTANVDGVYDIAPAPNAITAVSILDGGNYSVLPTGIISTTGGTGTGATFTILTSATFYDTHDPSIYQDWRRGVSAALSYSDAANDAWGITTTVSNVPAAGDPYITANSVQAFAESWHGTISDITATTVTISGSTFDFVTSPAFWTNTGAGFDDIKWTQDSYTPSPVVQTIVANYGDFSTGTSPNETAVRFERMAQDLTGDVSTNSNLQLKVSFAGEDILDRFVLQTHKYFDGTLAAYRYYISSATVDTIIAAGGIVSVTYATFLSYLLDKATTGQVIS